MSREESVTAEERVSPSTYVSTALIHNCHPKVAELIRETQGRSSRVQREAKHQELMDERRRCGELRAEIHGLRAKMAALASINEVILAENRQLSAASSAPGVRLIGTAKSKTLSCKAEEAASSQF